MFFPVLFLAITILFSPAFSMNFFKDDFFFLKISRIHSVGEFITFFSPIRTYSYKPLASEVFYFLTGRSPLAGHIVTFLTFFIGLYFLYKVLMRLSNDTLFSRLGVAIYAVSHVHVFQLYWLATFPEILVFTTLTASFYFFLEKKFISSIVLYICALLSKETAILYVVFLVLVELSLRAKYTTAKQSTLFLRDCRVSRLSRDPRNDIGWRRILQKLSPYIVISIVFFLVYQYSLSHVTSLDNYKVAFNPRLILNNALWYFLWALFSNPTVPRYFFSFFSFLSLFFVTSVLYFISNRKKIGSIIGLLICSLICFFIFLGPILFFPHRWMVRLTLPLIFISLFEAYMLVLFLREQWTLRGAAYALIILIGINAYLGARLHEETSYFQLDSYISTNASHYFETNRIAIEKAGSISFTGNVKKA